MKKTEKTRPKMAYLKVMSDNLYRKLNDTDINISFRIDGKKSMIKLIKCNNL